MIQFPGEISDTTKVRGNLTSNLNNILEIKNLK